MGYVLWMKEREKENKAGVDGGKGKGFESHGFVHWACVREINN